MNHALRAARLHRIGWPSTVFWPWAVMASSWVINWIIFAALHARDVEADFTGGLLSLYVVQFVFFAQLFTRGFQFAINLSFTRRAYYLGTWLVVLVLCLGNAIVLTALEAVEDLTDGWGIDLTFFGIPFMQTGNVVTQVLVYAGPFMVAGGVAAVFGLIGKRWSTNGVWTAVLLSVVVIGLLLALVSRQGWWVPIWNWATEQSSAALFALWPSLIAVVCAIGGFLVARRASF
jgi:hypothetical protein